MTCAEFQELAAAYVLGALDPEEREAARAHLREPTHEGCLEALERARSTAGRIPDALDDLRVSKETWDAIENRVTPRRRRNLVATLGWAAAVVLTLVAVWLGRARTQLERDRAQLIARLGTDRISQQAVAIMVMPRARVIRLRAQPGASGSALAMITPDGTRAVMATQDLPPVQGKDYQLWAIPTSGGPIPAGLIRDRSGTLATAEFSSQALPGAVALAVSLEPAGGSPTGKPSKVVFIGDLNG